MVSRYPNAIDGYSDIRIVRDSIEEVLARDHNDNRSAVVAVEQTLGLNPQGAYGTVVARLDQSDTDFGEHIGGTAHRHVTNHIDYPGSSPKVFADGYALVPSRLGSTLNEIVARLGASTPAGASGGDKIGITPFTTEHSKYSFPGTSVRSHTVATGAYLDENATLLERAFDAFVVDGMSVVDPYLTGTTARVAAGHIVSDGRLLRYNGGDLAVPESSTFYVVAQISGGSVLVTVEDATLPSLDLLNPVVLLHKITRDTGTWTESVDIRRFGLFVNDKNFISVGRTPINGQDGYGCDFLSLKGAVEYARVLATLDKFITPRKIVLVNDVVATTDADIDILLDSDLEGIEIDGCGKSLILDGGFTLPIFQINTSQVRIHDLTVLSAASAAPACFAHVGVTTYVSDVQIVRCGIKTQPGFAPVEKFLLLGETTGVVTVSDMLIANNTVSVANGGIVYADLTASYVPILFASKILGNHIYQDTVVTTLFPAIQASAECVVSDNIISGGFATGISLHAPIDTVVSNNLIIGTTVLLPPPPWSDPPPLGDYTMDTGIAAWVPGGVGNAYGALITNNIIKGVGTCGIDVAKTGVAGRQTIISDNIINNDVDSFLMAAIGIKVDRYDVPVVNNTIIGVGNPIVGANFVIGNGIYGHGMAAGDGILCVSSAPMAMVCNNRIYDLNCMGVSGASAININGSDDAIVSGNIVKECIGMGAGSFSAGINMGAAPGARAVIVGNVISHSTLAMGMMGISNIGSDSIVFGNVLENQELDAIQVTPYGPDPKTRISIIGNAAYNCAGVGIMALDATYCVIAHNMLVTAGSPGSGITGFASNSMVVGNIVNGYGGGGFSCIYSSGSYTSGVVANNLVLNAYSAPYSTEDAIAVKGWRDVAITGNVVTGTIGKGINVYQSARAVISGNLLYGRVNSTYGIVNVGQYSVVSDNAILGYGNGVTGIGITLRDAYSSAVVGNIIDAGPNMTKGIALTLGVAPETLDIVVADNVLYNLAYRGIDLNDLSSGRHVVANNVVVGTSQNNSAPGIGNIAQSTVIGNSVVNANGVGIHVAGAFGTVAVAVLNNFVFEAYEHGIHVDTALGCAVAGNYVVRGTESYGGVYLTDSTWNSVCGNYIMGFSVGIWVRTISGASMYNSVCANYLMHGTIGYNGILIDVSSTEASIVGNYIYGSTVGIELFSGSCLVASNRLVGYETAGIDAHGVDDLCISGNMVGPTSAATADGIDLGGCVQTLVSGNLAWGGTSAGSSFVIDTPQPANGVVMAGNLGRAGAAAPSNGAGGNWPGGWIIDVDCRWMA